MLLNSLQLRVRVKEVNEKFWDSSQHRLVNKGRQVLDIKHSPNQGIKTMTSSRVMGRPLNHQTAGDLLTRLSPQTGNNNSPVSLTGMVLKVVDLRARQGQKHRYPKKGDKIEDKIKVMTMPEVDRTASVLETGTIGKDVHM